MARKPIALIACDKFKGSLDAHQACSAVRRGLGDAWKVDFCPLADGGEGFVAAMVAAMRGTIIQARCEDPLGREVVAEYGIVNHHGHTTAVIEMAAASGQWRIKPGESDIGRASTFGTGQLMVDAMQRHAVRKIIIGIGGSATNDGGAGMAAALGIRFFSAGGELTRVMPLTLRDLVAVDFSHCRVLPEIVVACDVDNPLLGAKGATAVYGPQKGASAQDVIWLEEMLGKLVALTHGESWPTIAGAGAAGGLGFGLMRFAGARLLSGFDVVAAAIGLRDRATAADLIITGEGSLDEQSLAGKGPVALARLCAELGKPCVAVAGKITAAVVGSGYFTDMIDIASLTLDPHESMARAGEWLETIVHSREPFWRSIVEPR